MPALLVKGAKRSEHYKDRQGSKIIDRNEFFSNRKVPNTKSI